MKSLLTALALAASAPVLAQDPAAATAPVEPLSPVERPSPCTDWRHEALPEGPLQVGYLEGDVGVGRRACGRTEVALGGRLGAIIDTPAFYGNIVGQGVLSGSWAVKPDLEVFGAFEAVSFGFSQNATLKQTRLAMGSLTVGATRRMYAPRNLAGAVSARVLLPTSFETPGSRPVGLEVGHASSWRPAAWAEVHTWLSADGSLGLGTGPALPRIGATALAGLQLSPTDWFGFVLDLQGHGGVLLGSAGENSTSTWLAPTVGVRFRVARFSVELGGSLPLAGNDRHDAVAALKVAWRP